MLSLSMCVARFSTRAPSLLWRLRIRITTTETNVRGVQHNSVRSAQAAAGPSGFRGAPRGALDVAEPAEYSHSPSRRQDAQALHRYSPGGEYDGNEYGGLPAEPVVLHQMNQHPLHPARLASRAVCTKMVS